MATTGRSVVENALRKLGVLGTGQQMSAEDAQIGLENLNRMVGQWSIDGDSIFIATEDVFNLIGNKQDYTMGPGGDFDTVRPVDIQNAWCVSGQLSYPIVEYYDMREWGLISYKPLTSFTPTVMFDDGNFPLRTLRFYPMPTQNFEFHIYSRKPLSEFDMFTPVVLPPGYEDALIYNLAVMLAPDFQREPSQVTYKTALDTKSAIQRQNQKTDNYRMSADLGLLTYPRGFNIWGGGYQ